MRARIKNNLYVYADASLAGIFSFSFSDNYIFKTSTALFITNILGKSIKKINGITQTILL